MAEQQQSLRLFHASDSYCGVMVRGNIALSTGKSAEAIEHYTEVLYKLSPGHVCAFLNRSLAYLEEGYYELAVMDAHLAKIAADELRKTSPVADQRLSQVAKYINAERLHVGANDDWTKAAQRNIGEGWAKSPLASILVTATPEVRIPPFGTSRNTLARALEIRATYRLCGALFMVGDGARRDALDLIEDMKLSMKEKSWESYWFSKLGNDILDQLVSQVDPNDSMVIRVAGSDTREKRDERMNKLTEKMKATTTHNGYGDYPWNSDEPEFGGIYWQVRIKEWLEPWNDTFSAVVVHPQGTEGTQAKPQKPHVELRATRDFKSGELVLEEQRISNVSTFSLEPIKEDKGTQAKGLERHDKLRANQDTKSGDPVLLEQETSIPVTGILELSYCTGCASLLAIPRKFALKLQREQASKRPKYVVPACSLACRQLRLLLNIGLLPTNIEQELRKEHLELPNPRSITDCKTLCLRDLIFLRHVAMALNRGKSPLSFNQLVFATCGPHTHSISQITEVDPWSYMSHVVRPLEYLQKHLEYRKTDQFANLSNLDGWIIHALLSKISRGMRISHGPQYAQVFHKDGSPKTAFGPGHPRWEDLTKLPEDKDDDSLVWVAGIDPLFNMIRIADPAKGESPNVLVVQKDILYVYAIKTDDGLPAIKTGEPLLRAADGVENLALLGGKVYTLGAKVYTEEELDKDYLQVTEDDEDDGKDGEEDHYEDDDEYDHDHEDDASEPHSGDTSDFLEESSAEEGEDQTNDKGEGEVVLPAEEARVGDKDEDEVDEGEAVLPADDPRVGEWWSSWSWRGGRLRMG